jgi:hypothetical protein
MDKKLKPSIRAKSSASSSNSDSSSSSSDSESDTRKKAKKRSTKQKSSTRKQSGKDKKVTSYVRYPQKWPHSHLSLHFVNKDKKYEELTIPEFCAGFAAILEICSKDQKVYRIAHLKELMYLATTHFWKNVLNYHAACLLEIERGHLSWGDSFQMLQNTTLAGGFLHAQPRGSQNPRRANLGSGSNGGSFSNNDEGRIIFCRNYQRGICTHPRDHYGMFDGANRLLKHICAKCWLDNRQISNHPENAESCPLREANAANNS